MPNSPFASLAEIKQKYESLKLSREKALAENASLHEEIAQLKMDLAERDAQLSQARTDADFLALSHKLADSPEALVKARHIIGGLIKKVDAAIALVKNDPAAT